MRYLVSLFLLLFLLALPAQAESQKRQGGRESSVRALRQKPKYNLKPNVYSPKKNRPFVAKKRHWWQRR